MTKDDKQEKSVHASITLERKTCKRDVTLGTFITSLNIQGIHHQTTTIPLKITTM